MWVSGFANESNSSGEETVLVACGFGTNRLQFPERGENLGEIMSRVEWISHDLSDFFMK